MKRILLLCCLAVLNCFATKAAPVDNNDWDLVRVFQVSTHVFYGELTKVIPEPKFRTGVMGIEAQAIQESPLPLEPIIWEQGKHLTFKVQEGFKGHLPETFEAYRSDQDPQIWTYIANDAGDVFLAQPETLDPLLLKLQPSDQALFFVRYYLGSKTPVIYRVRRGQLAEDDLVLLRAQKASNGASLLTIFHQDRIKKQQLAQREAAEFTQFEDEYYKILRIQELEIRRSLLEDLVTRLGFEGRWEYYAYKERYLKQYGAYLDGVTEPPSPAGGKEKLWKDISDELSKIEVILKARASGR